MANWLILWFFSVSVANDYPDESDMEDDEYHPRRDGGDEDDEAFYNEDRQDFYSYAEEGEDDDDYWKCWGACVYLVSYVQILLLDVNGL